MESTIKNKLQGFVDFYGLGISKEKLADKDAEPVSYSYAPPPETHIEIDSGSEFASLVNGREQQEVLPIIDELMETLKMIQPRLYNAVINKLT